MVNRSTNVNNSRAENPVPRSVSWQLCSSLKKAPLLVQCPWARREPHIGVGWKQEKPRQTHVTGPDSQLGCECSRPGLRGVTSLSPCHLLSQLWRTQNLSYNFSQKTPQNKKLTPNPVELYVFWQHTVLSTAHMRQAGKGSMGGLTCAGRSRRQCLEGTASAPQGRLQARPTPDSRR